MTLPDKNILLIISVLIFLILVFVFWSYSIDDAFVTFRYAENFANGHGLVFNPGDKPVEGYSNFLWLLILSLLYSIGLPTYLSAKFLGIIFFLLSALAWFDYLRKDYSDNLWLAPILFLITPISSFWAVSGLELGLHSLLVTGTIISLLRRSYYSLLILPLLILSRPESFLIAFFALFLLWLSERKSPPVDKKYLLINLIFVIATIAALILCRMHEFGYPMPNTYYMKSKITLGAFIELGKQLLYFLPLTLLFIRRGVRLFGDDRNFGLMVFAVGLFLLQAAISINALVVMNFHFRYLVAFLPLFIIAALDGIPLLWIEKHGKLISILIFLSVLSPGVSVWSTVQKEKKIVAAQENFINWARPLSRSTKFSITDNGRIPYYTGKYFYDIWGLTSSEIAHNGFNPLVEYIRFPDYFVLVGYLDREIVSLRFGTEKLICQNRGFSEAYLLAGVARPSGASAFAPGYYYLVFRKDQRAVDSLLHTPPS